MRKHFIILKKTKEKWESRREREQIIMITRYNKHENKIKGVPKEWIDLVNYQTKICPLCGKRDKIMSPWHLKYYHGHEVKKVNTIWRKEICPLSTSIKRLMKLRTKIKMKQEIWKKDFTAKSMKYARRYMRGLTLTWIDMRHYLRGKRCALNNVYEI